MRAPVAFLAGFLITAAILVEVTRRAFAPRPCPCCPEEN